MVIISVGPRHRQELFSAWKNGLEPAIHQNQTPSNLSNVPPFEASSSVRVEGGA